MATLVHSDNGAAQMREKLNEYKEESEKVCYFYDIITRQLDWIQMFFV